MRIFVDGKAVSIKCKTVADFLEQKKINPESVLVERNGTLVTLDETLKQNDRISLIRVFSGG